MKSAPARIDKLFDEQVAAWPLLARGIDSLKNVRIRKVDVNGYRVFFRHLPPRILSTTAVVDRESIAKRPCFLCAANLPAEEKGIAFNSDFTIYCNPFPILDRHLTIVHNEHRPQRIAGQLDSMFSLAETFPDYMVIYNGPECGASAPDHMHFQAFLQSGVPVKDDVANNSGLKIPNYARHVLVLRNASPSQLESAIRRWNEVSPREPEPLLNLAVYRDPAGTVALLFPRSKHRPMVFHTGEFTVSPASIDLCGVFVTPVEKDFQRISGEDIRSIYEEVTCNYPLV